MKPKVLVTRNIFPETLSYLREHLDVTDNQSDEMMSADQLAAGLADKLGVMSSGSDSVNAALLAKVPHLKAICNIGVGYNNVDVKAASEHKMIVTNTPGVLDNTVADTAFAYVLATAKRMTESERFLRNGHWEKNTLTLMLGRDVHHATLGIIGMGRIGQAVARRVFSDALPRWGNNTTLSSSRNSLRKLGSFSNTSTPAPKILRCFSAAINATSSTMPPRAMLINTASDFIMAISAAPTR